MFRYERPQKGRSRQFHQFSAEVFGLNTPAVDAELITASASFWKAFGIYEDVTLEINNLGDDRARSNYVKELVDFLNGKLDDIDDDTRRKLKENPLRILDSKSKKIQEILNEAPIIEDFVSQSSKDYHNELLSMLDELNIAYEVNSKLVRGLDYYNQTVFEWKTGLLGSQDTILGGGRYDNLVEELGGKSCPAVGFSIGLERLILLLREKDRINLLNKLDIYFICLCEKSARKAIMTVEQLRNKFPSLSIKINLGFESANTQFKKADKSGAKIALIIGEEELENNAISFKNLREKSQQESFDLNGLFKKIGQFS